MMDLSGKECNVETQKGSDDHVSYDEPNLSSEWQVNLINTSIGMVPMGHTMVESSMRCSAPTVDSYCLPMWEQPNNGQSLGYCDVNVQNGASTSSSIGQVRPDVCWTSSAMFRGGMFPAVSGMLPQSLPQFPVDSAFIERAARFSCFSGGHFGEMMNPFGVSDSTLPYCRDVGLMQGRGDISIGIVQSQQCVTNVNEAAKEALLPGKHVSEGSPYKNKKIGNSLLRSYDEATRGAGVSGNESDEAEYSGQNGVQEEPTCTAGESPGLGSKKRKRGGQDTEHEDKNKDGQLPSVVDKAKDTTDIKQKGDQNPTSISKPSGKHGKEVGSQGSDQPKEEYIHVRARRGQATNSHSLAERVRREKISERMKFLQDLVPGCSKVTGKAVMLDEIINYVQSLQRQVEFLSMKLATVNPRLDANIEAFLAKDQITRPRTALSSSLAFTHDMAAIPFSPLHLLQPGLILGSQAGLLGNSSEPLRRSINSQSAAVSGGFKDLTSQIPSVWEDELHNIVHTGFSPNAPHDSQDICGSLPPGHMKAEP